jgi:hypothetical protein
MSKTRDGLTLSIEVSNRLFSGEDRFYLPPMGSEESELPSSLQIFKQLGECPRDETPRQPRPSGGENPHKNAYRRLREDFVRQVPGVGELSALAEQVGLMRIVEAAYRPTEMRREEDL